LLFDIDGTLLHTRAGHRAIEGAFQQVAGRPDAVAFSFAGMTDRAIIREGWRRIDVDATDARMTEVLETYLARLKDEVARCEEYRLLAGVLEALVALENKAQTAIGLGTGNVERGAKIKLGRAGIFERFDFGGYGDDSEDRATVLRRGAERGAQKLGVSFEACRVIVIGDTPRDIHAAKAIGAESLAVSNGFIPVADLATHDPTWAVESLDTNEAKSALDLA
jgi:phosphoglycolate phosphatase-like HAD superfamily hydrolase